MIDAKIYDHDEAWEIVCSVRRNIEFHARRWLRACDIEDGIHDTMIRIYIRLTTTGVDCESLIGYLDRFAWSFLRHYYSGRSIRPKSVSLEGIAKKESDGGIDSADWVPGCLSHDHDPSKEAERHETATSTWARINDLCDESERAVLLLRSSDISYAEMAPQMGLTPGRCKQIFYEATKRVRESFGIRVEKPSVNLHDLIVRSLENLGGKAHLKDIYHQLVAYGYGVGLPYRTMQNRVNSAIAKHRGRFVSLGNGNWGLQCMCDEPAGRAKTTRPKEIYRAVEAYKSANPDATWQEVFENVDNHYKNSRSLSELYRKVQLGSDQYRFLQETT